MIDPSRSFLLLVGDDGAMLLPPPRLSKGAPLFIESHADDRAQVLMDLIAASPRLPVILLDDTLAQDYRQETLPEALAFFDKKKLLARRLAQHFPNAPLRAALARKAGPQLLLGVGNEGPVPQWLARLAKLPNPSGAVALLPVESASMIGRLRPEARKGWALLLSWQRSGGFRQIVTLDGEILFTRLTPPPPASASLDFIAASLALDVQATRDYLARFGLGEDTPLPLIAILHDSMHDALRAAPLEDSSDVLFLTPHEAARKLDLGFAPDTGEPMADLLHLLWAGRKRRLTLPLMSRFVRERMVSSVVRRTGWALAVAILVVGMAWSGLDLFRLAQDSAQKTRLRDAIAALEKEIAEETHKTHDADEPLERLRRAVERRRLFQATPPTFIDDLPALAQALGAETRVVELEWQDGILSLDVRVAGARALGRKESWDRQEIVLAVEELAARLQSALPEYRTSILRYPFPYLPDEALTNKETATELEDPVARLALVREDRP